MSGEPFIVALLLANLRSKETDAAIVIPGLEPYVTSSSVYGFWVRTLINIGSLDQVVECDNYFAAGRIQHYVIYDDPFTNTRDG